MGDDVLVGNAGNDYLSGGDGNNTYIYTEGHDNINNEEYPSANEDFGFGDTLILSTLTRQQVIFSQDVQNASMLVIQVQGSDQHSVRLNGFFDVIGTAGPSTLAPSANAVEKIVFADGEMLTASQVAAIIGNTAPVLINEVFRAEVDEDGSIILDLLANAVDEDGQPLTLSNVTLADPTQGKLSFLDSQEVVFTPAADFNGQVELSYKVSDGVESVIGQAIITVNAVNDAPSTLVPVDSQEINENQVFTYQLPDEAFIDLDGDVLTYSATLSDDSALPSWLSFDANTQTFSGTPSFDDAGVLAIKVTANDGQATASQTFTLDVLDVNRAPVVIEPVVNQSTNENQVFTYQLPDEAFIDLDGDVLTYSATLSDDSALPSWLSFDANTQTFSGTPSFDDAGVLAIKVTANDGQATASQTFTLDVLDVNRAPVVIEPVVNQSTNENQVFTYQLPDEAFIDLDGDVLTYSATLSDDSALPSWLSFDANTQTFSGTPSFDDAGVLAIKVTANDGQATASQSFTLDVLDVNRAPVVIEPVVNQTTSENQAFSYQLPNEAFIDLDGDVLTYSATLSDDSALPSWLSFDANTQTFSGTPSFDDAGVLAIKVTANDGQATASQTFTLDVLDVNRAPVVIEPVINQSTNENQVFTYQLPDDAFIDLDGDVLTYSATLSDGSALPSWLSFDANTQTFSGTPSFDDAGVLAIKVTANDGQATASQTFINFIDVLDVNRAPDGDTACNLQKSRMHQRKPSLHLSIT